MRSNINFRKSLGYSLELHIKNISKEEIKTTINKILKTLELSHVRNALIKNLSGGKKKEPL